MLPGLFSGPLASPKESSFPRKCSAIVVDGHLDTANSGTARRNGDVARNWLSAKWNYGYVNETLFATPSVRTFSAFSRSFRAEIVTRRIFHANSHSPASPLPLPSNPLCVALRSFSSLLYLFSLRVAACNMIMKLP